jgi:hypothetical protein
VDEDFAIFKPDVGDFVVDFLLPVAGLHILSFRTVDESRIFVIKTVQPVRFLVDESVVLRHELPSDFRRNNTVVLGVAGGE